MVVVTDFWAFCYSLYNAVTADVTPSGIIIFILLAGTYALHRSISLKKRYDLCFPQNENVKKLDERVLSDFSHGSIINNIKSLSKDGCCCTHFVLLRVNNVLYLAF